MTTPRIPRSASVLERLALLRTVTSPFFTPNRFSVLPIEPCPRAVLVHRDRSQFTNAKERRRNFREAERQMAKEIEERKRWAAELSPIRRTAPFRQISPIYRRYFYGSPARELVSIDEKRVASRLISYREKRAIRVEDASGMNTRKVEVPLRERLLRGNLRRSLIVVKCNPNADENTATARPLLVLPAPTEPAGLVVEPSAAAVPANGGTSTHTLTNSADVKIVFKCKASNNNEYSVNLVFGFIESGATAEVVITRRPGPPKTDNFVIEYAPAPGGIVDAEEAFMGLTPFGAVTIPCTAA